MIRFLNYTKKILTLVVIGFCFLLFFSACDPASYSFDEEELLQKIQSIELIDYNSTSHIVYSRDEIEPFDFKKVTVLRSLRREDYPQFCKDLAELDFIDCYSYNKQYNSSACRLSLLITFNDGSFLVMSDNHKIESFVAEYNSDGQFYGRLLFITSTDLYNGILDNYFYSE